jgi:peroxiredoxin/Flp pilus assembly protein TadD
VLIFFVPQKNDFGAYVKTRILVFVIALFSITAVLIAEDSAPAANEAIDKGVQLFQSGKFDDAIKSFREAAKLTGESCSPCYVGIASAYMNNSDTAHALESSDSAIAQARDNTERAEAHDLKGRVILGAAGKDPKHLADAEQEFRQAVQLMPSLADAQFDMGITLVREGKAQDAMPSLQHYVDASPEGANRHWAQQMLKHPNRAGEDFAPAFTIKTLTGESISLDQLAGKHVVLDFWGTSCAPCRDSVGEMKDLVKKYPADRLVVISVSNDQNESAWREFVAKKKMNWPQYLDANRNITDLYHVNAIPAYVLIDGDGVIIRHIFASDPNATVVGQLQSDLKKAMESAPSAAKN